MMQVRSTSVRDGDDQVLRAISATAMAPRLRAQVASPATRARTACRIVDARHEPGERWVTLYEVGDELVLGILPRAVDTDEPGGAVTTEPSALRTYRFPDDPALPGLAMLFDPRRRGPLLASAIAPARLIHCRVAALRYRPLRRCTLRLDLAVRDERNDRLVRRVVFAKVYHDAGKAAAVHTEMVRLAGSRSLAGTGLRLAEPVGFVPDAAAVLQAPLSGRPLDGFIMTGAAARSPRRARTGELVRQAGAALAGLHEVELPTTRRRDIGSQVERMGGRARRVSQIDRDLGDGLGRVASALSESLPQLEAWGARGAFVHGDCKPSQFVVDDLGLGLLDFDHCGVADPACDLGDFVASLRQLAVHRQATSGRCPDAGWLRDLELQFLDARMSAGREEDVGLVLRARWYQAAALSRKAYRAFQRSSRSPLPAALAAEAERCLASLERGRP